MTKRTVSTKRKGAKRSVENPEIRRAAERAGIDWADESHTFGMARAAAQKLARDGVAKLDEAWEAMRHIKLDEPSVDNFYQEAKRRLENIRTVTIDRSDLHVVISELRDATLGVLDLMLDSAGANDEQLARVLRTIHGANDLLVRADGGAS